MIADTLRRAHLVDGLAWSSMAVLVRSATRQVPVLRRALAAAGVPVRVAGDELPLSRRAGDPAAAHPAALRAAPGCAGRGGRGRPAHRAARRHRRARPAAAAPRAARGGPGRRRAARRGSRWPRRCAIRASWPCSAGRPAGSGLAASAGRGRGPPGGGAAGAGGADRAGRGAPRTTCSGRCGTRPAWPAAWQQASAAGGSRGAAADADLDAVVALFDAAARFTARLPQGSPRLFLDSLAGQEIVGDTLADRAARGDAVAVLTAHRAKGLEWDLVVVAGVQEGTWPDLRIRGSLLGMDELVEAAAGRRARRGPASLPDDGRGRRARLQAARRGAQAVLRRGDPGPARPGRHRGRRRGRRGTAVPVPGRAGRRRHRARAGDRARAALAVAARAHRRAAPGRGRPRPGRCRCGGRPRPSWPGSPRPGVRGASPRQWYALTELSGPGPVTDGDVRLSPSQVEIVHQVRAALAAGVRGRGQQSRRAAPFRDRDPRRGRAGRRRRRRRRHHQAHRRDLAPPGLRQRLVQRQAAGAGASGWCRKFLDWHRANPRELVAVEQELRVRIGQVEITGRVDRLERDDRRQRDRRGPEDRVEPAGRRRAGPQPAARRVPAGRAARRVRASSA